MSPYFYIDFSQTGILKKHSRSVVCGGVKNDY